MILLNSSQTDGMSKNGKFLIIKMSEKSTIYTKIYRTDRFCDWYYIDIKSIIEKTN